MKRFWKILSVCLIVSALIAMSVIGVGAQTAVTSPADMNADQAISAAQGLFNQIAGTLNFANIAKVLGIGIAAVIGIWLAWWGLRKLFGMLQRALTKAQMRL